MSDNSKPSAEAIRAALAAEGAPRARELATQLGISEAELVAARVGHGTTRIEAHPDQIIAHVQNLGEVMALTRNESCVIEKVGVYENYRAGPHASMVINAEVDCRFFPRHWVYAFAVEVAGPDGTRRSLQVFDAAGAAVHKIHLRAASDLQEWERLKQALALPEQSDTLAPAAPVPTEGARGDAARADELRAEWDQMTDTHQFMRILRKLKMNRLGAYRMVGAPYVRPLDPGAIDTALTRLAETGLPSMIFVGNMGCIQIHGGKIETLKPMGPWINVLDPGFNIHLRGDHIAEVLAVEKPTDKGPALSLEAFDKDGMLILQIFGTRRESEADFDGWRAIVDALPTAAPVLEVAE